MEQSRCRCEGCSTRSGVEWSQEESRCRDAEQQSSLGRTVDALPLNPAHRCIVRRRRLIHPPSLHHDHRDAALRPSLESLRRAEAVAHTKPAKESDARRVVAVHVTPRRLRSARGRGGRGRRRGRARRGRARRELNLNVRIRRRRRRAAEDARSVSVAGLVGKSDDAAELRESRRSASELGVAKQHGQREAVSLIVLRAAKQDAQVRDVARRIEGGHAHHPRWRARQRSGGKVRGVHVGRHRRRDLANRWFPTRRVSSFELRDGVAREHRTTSSLVAMNAQWAHVERVERANGHVGDHAAQRRSRESLGGRR